MAHQFSFRTLLLLCLFTQASCTFFTTFTNPTDDFICDEDKTEFDIFDDFNDVANEILESTQFDMTKAATPDCIIDILETAGAIEVLEQDFYLKTYLLNRRNVLDLPVFLKDLQYKYDRYVVGIQIFYDQMTRANFSSKSTKIEKYLNITGDNFLEAVHNSIEKIKMNLGFDITLPLIDLFELMGQAKVQERRFGIMFHVMRKFKKARFLFYAPFYYFERNYFFTDEEREAIEALVGSTSPEDEEDLQKKHFICDKLGLGDTRLMLDVPAVRKKNYKLNLGVQATIPTAFALATGMLGSTYRDKNTQQPTISFIELFDGFLSTDPQIQAEAIDQAMEFFLGALDRLSAILLDTGLGNSGHFGLGIYGTTKTPLSVFIPRPWAHCIILKGRISLEYLFPKIERRYFVEKNNSDEFARRDFKDPNKAAENLAFLEQQFVNKFYPFVIDARVHPGIIFIWTSKLTYESQYCALHLGTDTYVKSPDRLSSIAAAPELLKRLDTDKAKGLWSYQSMIFGAITLKTHRSNEDLIIALHGATTFSNRGIGEQFTIGLTIEKNF